MTAPYRSRTIDERFFGHKTIVNLPVSLPPENLSEASAAPVANTTVAPDLIQSNNKTPSALSNQVLPSPSFWENTGKFIEKNWILVLVGVGTLVTVGVVLYRKRQKNKEKDQDHVNPTNQSQQVHCNSQPQETNHTNQPQQLYSDTEPRETYHNDQSQENYPTSQSERAYPHGQSQEIYINSQA